jgi:hypothetical protein
VVLIVLLLTLKIPLTILLIIRLFGFLHLPRVVNRDFLFHRCGWFGCGKSYPPVDEQSSVCGLWKTVGTRVETVV